MRESPRGSADPFQERLPRVLTPWSFLKRLRASRFEQRRQELRSYLEAATPVALRVDRLYRDWREAISDPVQDCQKAANVSAVYWWQVSDCLRTFGQLDPPAPARRYHRLFAEALRSASLGSEIAKNGFRSNKFSEVSRGLGHLDRYLELMTEAETELSRLVKRYRLVDEPGAV